jgi:hypothetical protein
MRISSSSVPGRRVGLTIPTTPRHNVKLIGVPASHMLHFDHYSFNAKPCADASLAPIEHHPCPTT